jgi:hypothetical protein
MNMQLIENRALAPSFFDLALAPFFFCWALAPSLFYLALAPFLFGCLKTTAIKKNGAEAPDAPNALDALAVPDCPGFSPILFHSCWFQPTGLMIDN